MNKNPDEVLKKDYLPRFSNISRLFSDSLERIEINNYVIDKIRKYPIVEIFNEYSVIISIIFYNSLEICILSFSKLISDDSNDSITLNSFKKEIVNNLTDVEIRNDFLNKFKEIHRKYKINDIKGKVRNIRNKFIAHNDMVLIDINKTIESILWTDFTKIIDYLRSIITLLIFGQSTLYINTFCYHPEMEINPRPENDFERVIKIVEDNSLFVNGIVKYEINREIFLENHNNEQIEYLRNILSRKGYENLI